MWFSWDGHCLLVEKIQFPSSSDEVEALAAVRAVTLAMDLNLLSFIVEGDSEVVISTLRKEEESFSSFGHLISSIKHYCETYCWLLCVDEGCSTTSQWCTFSRYWLISVYQFKWWFLNNNNNNNNNKKKRVKTPIYLDCIWLINLLWLMTFLYNKWGNTSY